jgi:hypothetical protein
MILVPVNITSKMTEEVFNSAADINFRISLNGDTILDEIYTPNNEQKIYIRGLGGFLENYLSGSFNTGRQENIAKIFYFNTVQPQPQPRFILLCKAYTGMDVNLFFGKKFLNLQYLKKITLPDTKEFLSAWFDEEEQQMEALIFYKQNGAVITSEKRTVFPTLAQPASDAGFYTVDVAFSKIAPLFPEINRSDIIAYSVCLGETVVQYQIDRQTYLDAKNFIYLNSFGVPESIVCRGEVRRKGVVKFGNSNIQGIEYKYNIKRADTFEVSSGKIYAQSDYRLFREMFNSEEVKVFFAGEYRKIIITEENTTVSSRRGTLDAVKFTFHFADPLHNMMITDNFHWILEESTWTDNRLWRDSGQWNDEP